MGNPHQRAGRDDYLQYYAENRIFMIRGQVLSNCLRKRWYSGPSTKLRAASMRSRYSVKSFLFIKGWL